MLLLHVLGALLIVLEHVTVGAWTMFGGVVLLASWVFIGGWLSLTATNYQKLAKELFQHTEKEIGGISKILQGTPYSMEGFWVLVLLIGGGSVLLMPFVYLRLVQIVLLCFGLALGFLYLAAFRQKTRVSGYHWTPSMFVWQANAFLAFYAIAPALAMFLCGPGSAGAATRLDPTVDRIALGAVIVAIAIVLLTLALKDRGFLRKLIAAVDDLRKHPETAMSKRDRPYWLVDLALLGFWLVFAGIQWTILYQIFFGFGPALFASDISSKQNLWTQLISQLEMTFGYVLQQPPVCRIAAKLFLSLYCLPLVLLLVFLIYRNFAQISTSLLKTSGKHEGRAYDAVESRISPICRFARVRAPRIDIAKSPLVQAAVQPPSIPGLRERLMISDGALRRLSDHQLEALLAHEIGHIKHRHTVLFAVLSFLSRWTFMGEGFLGVVTSGSIPMEKKADEFAIQWLEQTGRSREVLVDLLRVLEQEKVLLNLPLAMQTKIGFSDSGRADWLPQSVRTGIEQYEKASLQDRCKTIFRTVWFFYFENWPSFYAYLPYSLRIQAIRDWTQ